MARGYNPNNKFKNLGKITVPFGGKTKDEAFHAGVDIAGPSGTPIPATVHGVVTRTDGGHKHGEQNFGNTIELRDADGNVHQFHHLQHIGVKSGDVVRKGQTIGTLGDSGATYSPSGGPSSNLDYRIVSAAGKMVNPMSYLKGL